jgi:hypothetical protein
MRRHAPEPAQSRADAKPARSAAPATKKAAGALIDFNPVEWAPLNEAFARIRAAVGSRDLAEQVLSADLRSWRLRSMAWWVADRTGAETRARLDPSYWQGASFLAPRLPEWPQVRVRGLPLNGRSGMFYVSRVDLDRLYPVAGAPPQPPAPPTAPEPAPRLKSWVTLHEWSKIYPEIARRCIDPSGLLAIPQQNALVADMTAWCNLNLGGAPHERDLRKAVKAVCDGLNKGPEPAKKKPSR